MTQLVLLALSQDAYDAASSHSSKFEEWLAKANTFVVQGSSIYVPVNSLVEDASGIAAFQVVETEPVTHGLVRQGFTRLLLFSASSEDPSHLPEIDDECIEAEADDSLEIDERFLGNSVLFPIPPQLTSTNGTPSLDGGTPLSNGKAHLRMQISQEWMTDVNPLQAPFSADDDEAIYVQTKDLSRIGVLNGDWVSARDL